MKIDLRTEDGIDPFGIVVGGIVISVCAPNGSCANFMVKVDAPDTTNPTTADLVLVENIGVMLPNGNKTFRPVALDKTLSDAHIEDSLTMVNGILTPVAGYTISSITLRNFMVMLDRDGRTVEIETDDKEEDIRLVIDSNIYVVIDEYANKRYFGLTVPNLDIVELDTVEADEEEIEEKLPSLDIEDDDEDDDCNPEVEECDDDEEDSEEIIPEKVIAVLYDSESLEYINNHFSISEGELVQLNPNDIIYNYTVKDLELHSVPETLYVRGE